MMGLRVRNLIGDMQEITVMVSPNSDNFNCRDADMEGIIVMVYNWDIFFNAFP